MLQHQTLKLFDSQSHSAVSTSSTTSCSPSTVLCTTRQWRKVIQGWVWCLECCPDIIARACTALLVPLALECTFIMEACNHRKDIKALIVLQSPMFVHFVRTALRMWVL